MRCIEQLLTGLHRARAGNDHDLRAANFLVDTGGGIRITDFTFSRVGGPDRQDSQDVAEALVSVTSVVGTARAQDEACHWMDERTQGCDVAIIDVFLQRGTGLGVLEHIAGYEQPPRRVVLTNYATADMHQRCRDLGADAVFDKSTEIDQLIDWLTGAGVRH